MPRKKLIYTSDLPYHVRAISNNKEWFYLPIQQIWSIFVTNLININKRFEVQVHAFVLMNNHYHLLLTVGPNHNLGLVMCHFQKSISRSVNTISGRKNHVFGGPYKASLITTEDYYLTVHKYIYRNPVRAKITKTVQEYKFSTLLNDEIPLASPTNGIACLLPQKKLHEWLNIPLSSEDNGAVRRGLQKTCFKPTYLKKR